MKAAVYHHYGPPEVVRVEDVPRPDPRDEEVLIQVRATTVSSGDWRVRSLEVPRGFGPLARPMFGVRRPRQPILGTELAGTIAAVGRNVTRFRIGQAVFAFPGTDMGGHAEFRTMAEDGRVELMPPGFTFEEAAALSFGGTTALYYLRDKAGLVRGDSVLVVGASGTVGSAAVQIAHHLGARVTGVTSTANVERVADLGALRVIDYTVDDLLATPYTYDIILDTVGRAGAADYQPLLKPGGRVLLVAASLPQMLGGMWRSLTGRGRVRTGPARERREDLRDLKELAAAGRFRPLLDRSYPLDRIVDAHAHAQSGRKRGSVVVTM